MTDLTKMNEALNLYIRPQSFPVAVRMVSAGEEVPEKARQPVRDLGMPVPVCQGVALTRRYGWVMAMGKEDMLCPIGAVAMGLVPPKRKFLDGSIPVPNWLVDQEVRAKMAQSMPRFEYGKYTHLICAPLARADFEPQAIIIYGNPAQIMRLIQGVACKTGELVTSVSFGGGACGSYITKTILTDQCQFVLPGGGDRVFALTQDHELAFSMPLSKVEATIKGLEATHEAGMRYPVTSFLRFKAEFPATYTELLDYLKREGE